METMTVFEFITKNYNIFQKLHKNGKIPGSVALHYKIYMFYKALKHPKMLSYSITAEEFKLSETTVQRAVKEMEEKMVLKDRG